jgi:ATP-binding cassette, subfamily A (ABC1), member 3
VQHFFRLSPGFCFTDGLASLALRKQDMKLSSGRDDVLDWNITGASICYLAAEVSLRLLSPLSLPSLLVDARIFTQDSDPMCSRKFSHVIFVLT